MSRDVNATTPRRFKPSVVSGDAYRRLAEMLALLEAVRDRAEKYLAAGHGADCGCRWCAGDSYGDLAADDMAGLLWVVKAVCVSLDCGINKTRIGDRRVEVHVEHLSGREAARQMRGHRRHRRSRQCSDC
jgi:hypothetical protein